jgi:predicted ATP-grasp superfamily ATP-dependent carboligase
VAEALCALVEATGLRGLCGVDLIQDGDRWWLIEINPRPGASFELHERGHGLFGVHVGAVRGAAVRFDYPSAAPGCGLKIVYATGSLRVPLSFEWPQWVSDRPWPGALAVPGEPVCTVKASAQNSATARNLLERRYQRVMDRLEQWQQRQAEGRRSA